MERQEVRRVLLELSARAKHLARWPQALKPADIKAMADDLDMIRYFLTIVRAEAVKPPPRVIPEYLRCSECQALGIASGLPLWNLGGRWSCLRHIPADIPFPIGLWGDEWIASGRAPEAAGGRRRAEAIRPESWTPPEAGEPKPPRND